MRFRRQFSGQDLVEFALVVPFLLLLIMGIFDLGRVTFFYSTLTNISREGARYGVVHPCDDDGVIAAAKEKAIGIDPNDLIFNIPPALPHMWNPPDCSATDPPGRGTVIVSVSFEFIPITPFIADILGAEEEEGRKFIILNSTANMYLEL